jgi:hypothetical protein
VEGERERERENRELMRNIVGARAGGVGGGGENT